MCPTEEEVTNVQILAFGTTDFSGPPLLGFHEPSVNWFKALYGERPVGMGARGLRTQAQTQMAGELVGTLSATPFGTSHRLAVGQYSGFSECELWRWPP
jgi:hypothetical protein